MISRRGLLIAGTAVVAGTVSTAQAATAAPVGANTTGATGHRSLIPVAASDTPEQIIAKAAAVVPRPSQVAWQTREVTGFTHFGMNTFTNREWGSGCEDENTFAPPDVDIDQWMRVYRAAGMKQVMLTAKHHDGFVVYPTRYSNHSVVASPWWYRGGTPDLAARHARSGAAVARTTEPSAYWRIRSVGNVNPKGDILGTYLRAARAAGLKTGVYLSPADGAELPHDWHETFVAQIVAKHDAGTALSTEEQSTYDDRDRTPSGMGRYGSGSEVRTWTIPTLVPDDDRAEALRSGRLPRFRMRADDYNAYYLNQLYELFTQYGPIDELWLDGANPWASSGVSETYDFTAWFALIHALSPDTVTFAGPQGTRWVGNEAGRARASEWSVTPALADPATAHGETLLPGGPQTADLGSDAAITADGIRYLQWFPAEADVSVRPGWFWHPSQQPKSAAQLVQLYESSVGRNAVLLLNVPPATSGQVDPADVSVLTEFGHTIQQTYRHNLLSGARPAHLGRVVSDGKLTTSWSPSDGATSGSLELSTPAAVVFDRIRLGEDITRGQQVQRFAVDAWTGSDWTEIGSGTTIGYARILALPAPVTTERIRIRIEQARTTPHLATCGLFSSAPTKNTSTTAARNTADQDTAKQ
jgi:alpha-L-fucosidase